MSGFHDRHEGLFDTGELEDKLVLVVGCGSVGSELSMRLVRAGVRRLSLVDFDEVCESNLCRTVYLARDIGRPKVDALAERLEEVRPGLQIERSAVDLAAVDDDKLAQWTASADLVVAATDHPGAQARLGALSYHRKPALFIGVYAKGTGGEVLFTLPDETPCYSCVLGAVRGQDAPGRGQTDYGIATGQLAAEPALGIDILHVTVCAAKIALALLLRGTGAAVEGLVDPERSVLFVGNRAEWIWTEPLQTVWARASRLDKCICRIAPGGSTADLLDDLEHVA